MAGGITPAAQAAGGNADCSRVHHHARDKGKLAAYTYTARLFRDRQPWRGGVAGSRRVGGPSGAPRGGSPDAWRRLQASADAGRHEPQKSKLQFRSSWRCSRMPGGRIGFLPSEMYPRKAGHRWWLTEKRRERIPTERHLYRFLRVEHDSGMILLNSSTSSTSYSATTSQSLTRKGISARRSRAPL